MKITSLPSSGSIHQLSHVFSNYGYQPSTGAKITSSNSLVTGSYNRFVYNQGSVQNYFNSAQAVSNSEIYFRFVLIQCCSTM